MIQDEFFKRIVTQYQSNLPFVAYRKPNRQEVNAFIQKTDDLFFSEDYSEIGFVFAPFDDNEKSVLIPLEHSEILTADYQVSDIAKTSGVFKASDASEKENHINLVKKGIQGIEHEKFKKVVLSRSESAHLKENNPVVIFKRLLNNYPSAFVYCWFHPKVGLWLGATPETLIKIEGAQFSIMALAGTQSYNGTLNVKWQEKEKQEQQYVTDFITENLKPAVERLTVSDTETVKAGNLVHLKTMITARLKSHVPLKQVIDALHPTPAVCGVPKLAAKQFILEHENYNRSFYTGFLGELNMEKTARPRSGKRNIENRAYAMAKKSTQLYVNLRCMQIKDENAIIYIGGGITESSNPENEWQETVEKSLVMKNIL
ncbi:chorismate-binding protein [Tamlana crocina]|uniref:Chorismate-binding protein n=1 Tax=Tamlana crocina TaxID=393006 RepID=A0ABX1DEB7_9FLAO|nr:chorismate-binding protein [Tamlana crocina]NJX15546.1 chorismate-binding protein [Tamlana crocina]